MVLDIFDGFEKNYTIDDKFYGGFVEDCTPYQAEKTVLSGVQSRYLITLMGGFMDDVKQGAATFRQRAKEANLKKIQT